MQCPKGSNCTISTHTVKSLKTAKEWFPDAHKEQLPIKVYQETALNGRMFAIISDKSGDVIHRRG